MSVAVTGVQIRDGGITVKCWRCLRNAVPDVDHHIGLCNDCLTLLRDEDHRLGVAQEAS